jgi:exopolyphosphatase/guanosine-5'-triphosphate,3'-diphosphate pyrophosphatase
MALHGNWVGVTPSQRVIMAQALSSNFGHEGLPDPAVMQLCSESELKRAHQWGVAMRLGQRLSGGVASVLKRSSLAIDDGVLRLDVADAEAALIGDQVRRRLARLAEAIGCEVKSR